MFERIKQILKKKELDPDKEGIELEKNDFLAILIALSSYMWPVLLGFFLIIALMIWVLF